MERQLHDPVVPLPAQRLSRESFHVRFPAVHRRNLRRKAPVDGVAPQLPVAGHQPVSGDKQVRQYREVSHLPVMRQIRVHRIDRFLRVRRRDVAGDQRAEIPAPVAHHHYLLRSGQQLRDPFFNRLRRHVVARIQNNQVLDPSADPPISKLVHFTLIAGIKPAIFQYPFGLLGLVPILRKNMRPSHQNLFVFTKLHFNSGNRLAHVPRLHRHRGIVHRADRCRFRQPVDLQYRNPQHHKKLLCFHRQRRRTANQRAQVPSKLVFDLSENQPPPQRQPQRIHSIQPPEFHLSLALPAFFRPPEQRANGKCLPGNAVQRAAPHPLQQCRHIQEIIRRRNANLFGQAVQVRR